MSQPVRSFDRMIIPAPCNADWDSMVGNDTVRFCEHCQLQVTNLSSLTRQEAMRLVANSKGRLGVRYMQGPGGGVRTKELPRKLHQISRRFSRLAAGAFTATLSLSSAAAQTASNMASREQTTIAAAVNNEGSCALSGVISDPMGAVVAGASIRLTNDQISSAFTYTTGDDGMYRFSLLPKGHYRLEVAAAGFREVKPTEIDLTNGIERTINVELQVPQIEVEVSVLDQPRNERAGVAGAVVFVEPEEPLVKAAFTEDLEAVRQMAFSALDLNVRDKNTRTTALEHAVEAGNAEILRLLVLAGASVNTKNDSDRTPLMYLRDNATAALVRELISAGAKVNARDESGGTALMNAAAECNYEVVRELIDAGAKIELEDADGKTALMFGATNEDPKIAKTLIDAGANVNAKNHDGQTALMMAAEEGDPETVKLLISFNADVNARDNNGRTALMYVADTIDVESAEALLNAGADLSLRDKENKTALTLARDSQHEQMIKLLESRGAPE